MSQCETVLEVLSDNFIESPSRPGWLEYDPAGRRTWVRCASERGHEGGHNLSQRLDAETKEIAGVKWWVMPRCVVTRELDGEPCGCRLPLGHEGDHFWDLQFALLLRQQNSATVLVPVERDGK